MKQFIAQFNSFELALPEDVVNSCMHSGPCDDDVKAAIQRPEVIAELNKIDPEKLKKELKEYGAWNDKELNDHQMNLERILWIAAGDIQEEEFLKNNED